MNQCVVEVGMYLGGGREVGCMWVGLGRSEVGCGWACMGRGERERVGIACRIRGIEN